MPTQPTTNLWQQTATTNISASILKNVIETEIAIIGAGFTGCSAALHLAQGGAKVVVLEAHTIGFGGSGRNVGLANAGLWTPPEEVEALMGKAAGQQLNNVLAQGPALVFELIKQHQIECEAVHNGTLHCAHSEAGLADLKERLSQYNARGAGVQVLDANQTQQLTGAQGLHGALLDKRAGTVQPLAYVQGLAQAASLAGAQFYTQTLINEFSYQQDRWLLESPQGQVTAKYLILATNAYYNAKPHPHQPSYTPLHYFQLATQPLTPALLQTILPQKQGCWDTATVMTSFRLDKSGRMIIGSMGALEGVGEAAHRAWARRKLAQLYPALAQYEFEHAWFGRIAMTQDHIPKIVQLGANAWSVFGYSGRGIAPGTVFGKGLAEFILTGDETVLPLSPLTQPYQETFTALKGHYYELGASAVHWVSAR